MGIRNKHLFKRLGLLFMVGVLLSSALVSLTPEPSFAKTVPEMTVEEEAASVTYYSSLTWCMQNSMNANIPTIQGESGATQPKNSWFNWTYDNSKNLTIYNHTTKTVASGQHCKDVIVLALKLWGWNDYKGFLEDMGYKWDSAVPEWRRADGAPGTSLRERFESQVQSKVYLKNFNFDESNTATSARGIPISPLAEMLLLAPIFDTYCKGINLGLFPSGISDPTIRNLVTQRGTEGSGTTEVQYDHLQWFNSNTSTAGEYGIKYTIGGGNPTIHGDGIRAGSCEKVVERISAIAKDAALQAAEAACKTAGALTLFPDGNASTVLRACANGYTNKTPFTYCAVTYPTSSSSNTILRKACYFGQGNEAGEACALAGFVSSTTFAACIAGSKNKTAGYCEQTYADRADVSSGQVRSRKDERNACLQGQKIEISNAVVEERAFGPECGFDAAAVGCESVDTSCGVAGIGWMVCPIINFLAGVGDSAYAVLADNFLETNVNIVATEDANGQPNGTYVAWGIIRSIANVVFVIVFLFIIFSQLTGAGVSNYGVKKMLPRLVIGVILVNLSFTVCQLAVDVSNILGHSINDVFSGVADRINQTYDRDDPIGLVSGGTDTLAGAFGTILSVGVVGVGGYFLLSAGGTLLVAALLGLLLTLLILVLRQVIIVLAIVVAPLVFVAWILPNTETFFKQWVKIFAGMLGLFPLVALIFGGATLASAVIGSIAVSNNDMLWQLIASLLPAVALLAVIPAIQGALKAVPALGKLAGSLTSKANSSLRSNAQKSYQGSVIGRGATIRKAGRENYRSKKFAERIAKGGASRFFAQGIGVTEESRAAQKTLLQSALATEQKARAEEVTAAKAIIEHANLSGSQRQALARGEAVSINGTQYKGGDVQKAAIDMQMQTGSYDEVHELVSKSGGALLEHSQRIQQGLIANGWGAKSPAFAGKNLDKIAQGGIKSEADIDTAMLSAITEGRYTAEALAGMNNSARQRVIDAAKKSTNPDHLAALKAAAAQIASTPELQGKVAGNTDAEKHIYTDLA
jgi:hypothetical protein